MAERLCVCPKCWGLMGWHEVHDQAHDRCKWCKIGEVVECGKVDIPAPAVGTLLLCLVCAFEKPWGIWDSKSGTAVCVECRDRARGG